MDLSFSSFPELRSNSRGIQQSGMAAIYRDRRRLGWIPLEFPKGNSGNDGRMNDHATTPV